MDGVFFTFLVLGACSAVDNAQRAGWTMGPMYQVWEKQQVYTNHSKFYKEKPSTGGCYQKVF